MDLLGYGSNAPNVVITRPNDTRVFGTGDTWGKDCSSPGAGDGTGILAGFTNGLLGQLRALIRGNGKTAALSDVVTEDNSDDTMALKAIQHLIQRGQPTFGVDQGAKNALVVALSPPMAEYKRGARIRVLVGNDNDDAAVIDVSGLGAKVIVRKGAKPLQKRDLLAGSIVTLDYDGTQWQLEMPDGFSRAAEIVTSSAALNLTLAQRAIAMKRTVDVAAMPIALPGAAKNGHEVVIDDVTGNFNQFKVTVSAPGGESIAGAASYVMDRDFQSTLFRLYDDGTTRIWSRST